MGISRKLGGPDAAAPTYAADFPTKVAPARAYRWTGPYVGANFGGAFGYEDVTTPIGVSATDATGVLGGLQLGYNYKFAPAWLIGIETEFDWTSAQGKTNFVDPAGTAALSVTSDHNWYGPFSGRGGYVTGPLMLCGKGGAAWMDP